MRFIINFLGWITLFAIVITFVFDDSSSTSTYQSPSKKTYEYHNVSYEIMNSEVGCESKYSEDKKEHIWDDTYKNKKMIWTGEVVHIKDNRVSLNMDGVGIQDLIVELESKSVAYNLMIGDQITVDFLMYSQGGCILPFSGKYGVVKKILR